MNDLNREVMDEIMADAQIKPLKADQEEEEYSIMSMSMSMEQARSDEQVIHEEVEEGQEAAPMMRMAIEVVSSDEE